MDNISFTREDSNRIVRIETILTDFCEKQFPAHEKKDDETAKIAKAAERKISKAVWTSAGAIGLIMVAEACRALGWIH